MSRWLVLLLLVPGLAWAGASRDFDGVDDRLESTSAAVTAAPFSNTIWFNHDISGTEILAMPGGHASSANDRFAIFLQSTDTVRFQSCEGTCRFAETSTTATNNVWQHAAGQTAGATDRKVQLNAAGEGTNTESRTPSTLTLTRVGDFVLSGSDSFFWDGELAFYSIWEGGSVLTDQEIDELNVGMWPSWIRTETLTHFWPIFGVDSPELDLIGGLTLTVTEAASSTGGPPVFFPIGGQ